MTPRAQPLPLTVYRILGLTTESAHLAGKLLADLGCQVIKVEPPSGDPAGRKDTAETPTRGARTRLFWLAYNTGKLGVTLDVHNRYVFQGMLGLSNQELVTLKATGAM